MKTYVAGSKNEYVSCLAYKLNAFGFSADAALEFICQEFPDYERPKAVVDSCYRQTEEHGKRKHELQSRRHEAGKSASVNDIIKFLGEHVELRYNQITMRVEYRMKEEGNGEDSSAPRLWQIINDRAVNTLWSEMSKTNRAAVQDFFRVIESNYVQPFNPFIDYLANLPEWHEGDTDYIQQLADSVTIKGGEEQQKLWTCYLRKWLVGMLAGWTLDDVVNNVIIVLIGKQGSGKSTWIAMVLPPELRQYFYTKTNASRLTKDDLLVLATYGLMLCEELDTMKPSELNQLKAAVTMLTIDERAAYAHYAEHRPHIASFAATGNNVQFLSDPTGNRRWLPFEVESIVSPRDHPFHYEGIYSQALALYESGFQYWFTKEEIQELNRHNRQFETPHLERELVSLYFRVPQEGENGMFMTSARAIQIVGTGISQKLNPTRVGLSFNELGFQRVRYHGIRGYLVIQRTAEEMQAYQKGIILNDETEDDLPF